jgi:alkaline phosphatase
MSQAFICGGHAEVIPTVAPTPTTPADTTKTYWADSGKAKLNQLKTDSYKLNPTRAKNVILFVGDGMGISTITAARILEGQKIKGSTKGEENLLSFEQFPNAALSRTYSVNQQVSDSAPTMTAMVTGVKNNDSALSVTADAAKSTDLTSNAQKLKTILEQAKERGMAAGVVTTARVTHATPAACYAHTTNRNWESDTDVSAGKTTKDIAAQLLDSNAGKSIEVVLGGGRTYFMPSNQFDPEYTTIPGKRRATTGTPAGRDLISEWKKLPARVVDPTTGAVSSAVIADNPRSAYVWKKSDFDAINPANVDRLLGLFEPSHVQYEADRENDPAGEPSLADMTTKAIDILAKNRNGYFLMVEGGRIDHGHHAGNAYRALTDAIALSNAVKAAADKVGQDTLIVVTADHSHVFTIAGYPERGNPILGLVKVGGSTTKDMLGLPYTTLGYANGPGYTGALTGSSATSYASNAAEGLKLQKTALSEGDGGATYYVSSVTGITAGRPNLAAAGVNTEARDFMQEATVPLSSETHAGEDVAIFAKGPNAHLFHGTLEQSMIYWIMADALRLPQINGTAVWPQN